MQVGLDVWCVSGQAVKGVEGNRACAAWTLNVDHGAERCERHTHVRWMRGDAARRGSEDCVHPIDAVDRITPRPRAPLVTLRGLVVEVGTAGSLHQVAADRGHVANLSRGAEHDCL